MEARTFESPMDWEYNDKGPLDPTSPFAQAANKTSRNTFGSPFKPSSRPPNPFARLQSASKSQSQPPQTARFTPQLPSKSIAPPFRNPAFTTPRKPIDEVILSEASGGEDSPAPTEASDYHNDTPDVDQRAGISIGATVTPLKVDKSSRYAKSNGVSRMHATGKGDIRGAHGLHISMRKRKRHNLDKDVSSGPRRGSSTGAPDSDSDASEFVRQGGRSKYKEKSEEERGPFESFFHALNKYPHTPDHMQRWMQLGANVFLISVLTYICWSVVTTVRTDIYNANSAAQQKLVSQMEGCRSHYTSNNCGDNDRPALKAICEEWYDCMMQDPDAIMRVKVTAKQVAEIINEFTEAMHIKAWGVILAIVLICTTVNLGSFGRQNNSHRNLDPVSSQPSAAVHDYSRSPDITPGFMLVPVQTPRKHRQALLDEGTDTDNSPTGTCFFTPSGRRSPSKGDRQLSPVKNWKSPTKTF